MNTNSLFELSVNEGKVMDVFMRLGTVSTSDITKATGISRPNCYDLLNKLIEKGLVTKFTENKAVRYRVNELDYADVLRAKEAELSRLRADVQDYNAHVMQAMLESGDRHKVEIFTGVKGLQKFYSQSFDTERVNVFGAEGVLEEKYPHIWNMWINKITANNIPLYVIYNEQSRKLREKRRLPIIKHRYIDRDSTLNVTTTVMDGQVNLFHWDDVPLVIVIKSKKIAHAYREEFNLMWKHARK